MKIIIFILVISASIFANGQQLDMLKKLEPVDGEFWYKISDNLEFKGRRWICTLPVSTVFTSVSYDTANATLNVKGQCLFGGDISDSITHGLPGARIFLLNLDASGRIKKVFDLGETSEEHKSPRTHILAGQFSRMFTVDKNDILVIGLSGIGGATAFHVGKLVHQAETDPCIRGNITTR